MRALIENSYIEMTFGRFRIARHPALSPYLLLVDCETRRFTIERPATIECFNSWCREVEHAIAAGRHIVCVPIQDKSTGEIESLGSSLGYALWPSRTILSPPVSQEAQKPGLVPGTDRAARRRDDEQKKRLLTRIGAA